MLLPFEQSVESGFPIVLHGSQQFTVLHMRRLQFVMQLGLPLQECVVVDLLEHHRKFFLIWDPWGQSELLRAAGLGYSRSTD